MSEVVAILRGEHANMVKLLAMLRQQIELIAAGEIPDYAMLHDIIKFILDYFDRYHHPKEDLLFETLLARDPDAVEMVGDLREEHRKLAALAEALAASVRDVVMEVQVPRHALTLAAREFIAQSHRHMEKEETYFLPLADERLTDADWAAVGAAMAERADPLLGTDEQDAFQAIRKEIERFVGPG